MSSSSLSLESINAISWVLGGVAIVMSAGRFWTRSIVLKSLRLDDAVHGLALVLLIASLATFSAIIPTAQSVLDYSAGITKQYPDVVAYQQANVVVTILFYSIIWAVKLAFMLFYRQLFWVSASFIKAWWSTMALLIASYWVCIGLSLAQCDGNAKYLLDFAICYGSPRSVALQHDIYIINYCMNVSTDLAIMALPMRMLKTLRMHLVQKIGLGTMFCLTLFVVALESLRLAKSLPGNGGTIDILWDNLEICVAVIVSCLPSYYALFKHGKTTWSQRKSGASFQRLALHTSADGSSKSQHTGSISTKKESSFSHGEQTIPMETFDLP